MRLRRIGVTKEPNREIINRITKPCPGDIEEEYRIRALSKTNRRKTKCRTKDYKSNNDSSLFLNHCQLPEGNMPYSLAPVNAMSGTLILASEHVSHTC